MEQGSLVAVTVVGNDRPGIVAAVTRVLYQAGCNLLDSTSTILHGHFSMMLIVVLPPDLEHEQLASQLHPVETELGLTITVAAVEEAASDVAPANHMVSVYGADKPGIVFKVTQRLAENGVNITALSSRVIGSEDQPVYALMLEVASDSDVAAEMQSLREELDVDISVHPIDTAVL